MQQIAFIWENTNIYWSGIIIALGVLAAILMTLSLRLVQGRSLAAPALLAPVAIIFSFFAARIIHWYCHYRLYDSLRTALTDYSVGAFSLTGVFVGVILAALLLRGVRVTRHLGALLDCAAPAGALGIAVGRLSAYFNAYDRGKIVFTSESYQGLPWSTAVESSSGGVEWRFATFFWESGVTFIIFIILTVLFLLSLRKLKAHFRKGDIFWLFLALYGAAEIVLDSTRYDSSFLRSNGFVSLVQIISAVTIVVAAVLFSVRGIRRRGLRPWYFLLWLLLLAALGDAGYMEYYVQRHSDLYVFSYSIMSAGMLAAAADIFVLHRAAARGSNSTEN